MAMNPNSKKDWFLRRMYLEGRLREFLNFRRGLVERGEAETWARSFWPAAKHKFFKHKSEEEDRKICAKLEASDLERNRTQELMAKKKADDDRFEYDENVSYYDSVKWAFENWPQFVSVRAGNNVIINEGRMRREAPSRGAVGMIQFACDNLKDFQALCARVLSKNQQEINPDETNTEEVKDTGCEDLEAILKSI